MTRKHLERSFIWTDRVHLLRQVIHDFGDPVFAFEDQGVGKCWIGFGGSLLLSLRQRDLFVSPHTRQRLAECAMLSDLHGDVFELGDALLACLSRRGEVAVPIFFALGPAHLWEHSRSKGYARIHAGPRSVDGVLFSPKSLIEVSREGTVSAIGMVPSVFRDLLAKVGHLGPAAPSATLLPRSVSLGVDYVRYESMVKRAKALIASGHAYQIVLSVEARAALGDQAMNLDTVWADDGTGFPFLFYGNRGLTLVGKSPELHLRSSGRRLEMVPLAGTRRSDGEIQFGTKEIAEHIMLVDLCRNDLGRCSVVGSVRVPEFLVEAPFGEVVHLGSRVTSLARPDVSGFASLRSVSPAGTMTGAPTFAAARYIEEIEGDDRGFYSGTVGLGWENGDLVSALAIRFVAVQDGIARIRAGGGITADSDARSEWQEALLKLKRPLSSLHGQVLHLG